MSLLVISLTFVAFIVVGENKFASTSPPEREYVIYIKGQEVLRRPLLSRIEEISLSLSNSGNRDEQAIIRLANGEVRIAPMSRQICPRQICCHYSRPISMPGQSIVCLPNLLEVRIELAPGSQLEYDILAG